MDYKTRSFERIRTLHPAVIPAATRVFERAYAEGIPVQVTQAMRTIEEQNALYAIGRRGVKGEKVVTNAKGGYSYHNYGLAFDICLIQNGQAVWTVNNQWKRFVQIAKAEGFEWGGDWKDFPDYPHFQMTFGLSINDLLKGKRPPLPVAKKPAVQAAAQKEEPEVKPMMINVQTGCGLKKVEGRVENGVSYLPTRVLEEMGFKVTWDEKTKEVSVTR